MANNALSIPNNIGATASDSASEKDQSLRLFVSNLVEGTSDTQLKQKIQESMHIQVHSVETRVDKKQV